MPFLRLDEQDLYYAWTRAGDGPAILFIHGLGSSSSFFAPIIPSLVDDGFSCLAFDTPGSASSKYRGRDSDCEALGAAAGALVASLGLDPRRLIVVGHSMGALVAAELALRLDVRAVALIGPIEPAAGLSELFAARIKLVESEGMEAVADTIPLAATGPRASSVSRAFIRALLLAQSPEGYASLCRTIAHARRPRYDAIRCPLLVIAGSHDRTSPSEAAHAILESWGAEEDQKHVRVLEGVGHWHCVEAADDVYAAMKEFLGCLRKGP
ncbi:hypothetical protein CDD83_4051 [Cordyceps sp. RAO-2017]|nr:hypothetical protein CDD83_4051 [Cordyceps sp. RAO-2017]